MLKVSANEDNNSLVGVVGILTPERWKQSAFSSKAQREWPLLCSGCVVI